MYNENMTEANAVLAQLASASQSVAAHAVGPVNVQNLRRIWAIIDIGALGASGTVDFQFQASATQGGTYALVAGTAITQITAGSTNLVTVELRMETLMNGGQGPWVRGVLTIGTAASQVGVVLLGSSSRYSPASDFNMGSGITQQLVA